MVAGHLREINGFYYMVISYKEKNGKRKNHTKATGLPIKGNKKKAEHMLLQAKMEMEMILMHKSARIQPALLSHRLMVGLLDIFTVFYV